MSTQTFLDGIAAINKDVCDDIDKDLDTVSRIDDKIIRLLDQRNYVLFGLNCKCLKSKNAATCLGCDPFKIWDEYKEKGFHSKRVKDAVANVRALFFDDSLEEYRKFSCVNIRHSDYGCESDIIELVFEDADGHSLKFTFDIRKWPDDYLYTNKHLNGYIYLMALIDNDYYTIERSFDVKTIRAATEKWFNAGFVGEKFKFEHESVMDKACKIMAKFKNMRVYEDDLV